MRQLFRFMYQHGSHLAFGAIVMAMSSFGQAYFVSFPVAAVQINYLTKWRIVWLINAAVLVAGVTLAVRCLPHAAEKPLRTFRKRGAVKVREASVRKSRNHLYKYSRGCRRTNR